MSKKKRPILERLHDLSIYNKEALEWEWQACCFSCFAKFHPDKITSWTDNQTTAHCPKCGIDSVLPGDFSETVLDELHDTYFEFEI